ncbi:MAG: hypothetical protein M1817_001498 [Caeruleum heppii]|nr:MAG: hypothetical protein M1817_001498 [Caeruleum heppii]
MAHEAYRGPHPDLPHQQPPYLDHHDPRNQRPPQQMPTGFPPQHQDNHEQRSRPASFARPEHYQPDLNRYAPPAPPPAHPQNLHNEAGPPTYPRDPPSRHSSNARPESYHAPPPPPPPPAPAPAPARPESIYAGGLPFTSPPIQPINDAVSSAFSGADTSAYPPELVAQIAEDVIKRLKSVNLDASTAPPPPAAPSHSDSATNSDSPTMQSRGVYTPPSPTRFRPDFPAYGSPPQHHPLPGSGPRSPEHPPSPDEPRSPKSPPAHPRPGERGPPSPEKTEAPRPPLANRQPTDKDETPLDRTWGKLFEDGRSTPRLGQFLRGLANHIIEDFEPKNSIVVTPVKMAKYYELCRLPSEIWPWTRLFKELSMSRLSRIYQELECQHHLVQDRPENIPTIPGLTAAGFERWMTLVMLAGPDDEVERLQKAVLEMPISNADDQKERFPKEISRRLFPKEIDHKARMKVEKAFAQEGRTSNARRTGAGGYGGRPVSIHNPINPVSSLAAQLERERQPYSGTPCDNSDDGLPPPPRDNKIERERAPYSGTPSEASVEDNTPLPPGASIERERKPYSAQPGEGRRILEEQLKPSPAMAGSSGMPPRERASKPRTQSASGRPVDFPIPDMHRMGRSASIINPPQHAGPPVTNHRDRGRRRSPSVSHASGPFRRSDNDMLGYPDPSSGPIDIGISADDANARRAAAQHHRGEYRRGAPPSEGSPSRGFESPRDRERYDRMAEQQGVPPPRRGYEEEYYRSRGGERDRRGGDGHGFDGNYSSSYR